MRKLRIMRLAVVVCLGTATAALANSIPAGTYDLSNVSVDGIGFTGAVTLDTNGIVTQANITLNDAEFGNPVFNEITSVGGPSGSNPSINYADIEDPGEGELAVEYLTAPDASGDVALCLVSANNCNAMESYVESYSQSGIGNYTFALDSGKLDPETAPTPEPASLALLGTALIALVKLSRPRARRRGLLVRN